MTELAEAGRRVAAMVEREAATLGDPAFAEAIWRATREFLPKGGAGAPGAGWRIRIMLFGEGDDLQADTMPDAEPEALGDELAPSLPAVARTLASMAYMYHQERGDPQPIGLDEAELLRRTKALRVSLSRSGGACWWRVPYTVAGVPWRAMVRVARMEG